jgi:DNA-binding IclR family transcriptional regulator
MSRNTKARAVMTVERSDNRDNKLKNILGGVDGEKKDMMQIHRASKIITCISQGVNSLSDIADYCRLSKSTVHRLLKAMVKSHFIIYNALNRQYLIGKLITDIASRPETYHDYLKIWAGKELEKVAEITEETVLLTVLIGLRQIRILSIPSKHDLRVVEEPGRIGNYFAGAGSQVLLSQLKDNEIKTALKHLNMEKLTSHTIVDKDALLARIRRIRRQGYAVSDGERIAGAMCVAAPIRKYMLPAALIVAGPQGRMKEKAESVIDLVLKVADRISFNIPDIHQPKA